MQATNCNAQVPAKIYEYLRADRPILALTDPAGNTAQTLRAAGVGLIAHLDCAHEIERALLELIDQISANTWTHASPETVAAYSRSRQAGRLAQLMQDVCDLRRTGSSCRKTVRLPPVSE
jgi:hypothetical protein